MNRRADLYETPSGQWFGKVYYSSLDGPEDTLPYKTFTSASFKEAVLEVTKIAAHRGRDYDVTMHSLVASDPFVVFAPLNVGDWKEDTYG